MSYPVFSSGAWFRFGLRLPRQRGPNTSTVSPFLGTVVFLGEFFMQLEGEGAEWGDRWYEPYRIQVST